ncbi:hypothetical protein B0T14DRAFT_130258 [Immersiella caudata]|uniref:Uncharacterized protein n=1 Tax=Immersiella caudata TaxID=314043 RepID=A0AA40C7M4_9PEZI|nr:hypothetical protein B0T14DRAFT_130258 [Immersiella caudata]
MSVSSSPHHPRTPGSSDSGDEPGPAAASQPKPREIGLETSCCFLAPLPECPPTLTERLDDWSASVACVGSALEQLSSELPAISKRESAHLPADEPSPPPLARYATPPPSSREWFSEAVVTNDPPVQPPLKPKRLSLQLCSRGGGEERERRLGLLMRGLEWGGQAREGDSALLSTHSGTHCKEGLALGFGSRRELLGWFITNGLSAVHLAMKRNVEHPVTHPGQFAASKSSVCPVRR